MGYSFDHLLAGASSLEAGKSWAQSLLDIEMSPASAQPEMGVLSHGATLDPDASFEVAALDPEAASAECQNAFGLAGFEGAPRLITWAVRCDNLEAAQALAPNHAWRIVSIWREGAELRMLVPEDGAPLFGGCFPLLVEWASEKPMQTGLRHDLRLRRLKLMHPEADKLRVALAPFASAMDHVSIGHSAQAKLQAEIGTPTGEVWIT